MKGLSGEFIFDRAVRGVYFNEGTVRGVHFNEGTVRGVYFNEGTVRGVHFNEGTVSGVHFNEGTVRGVHFNEGAVRGVHKFFVCVGRCLGGLGVYVCVLVLTIIWRQQSRTSYYWSTWTRWRTLKWTTPTNWPAVATGTLPCLDSSLYQTGKMPKKTALQPHPLLSPMDCDCTSRCQN